MVLQIKVISFFFMTIFYMTDPQTNAPWSDWSKRLKIKIQNNVTDSIYPYFNPQCNRPYSITTLYTHFQQKYPNHTDDKPQEKTRSLSLSLSLSLSINTIPSLKVPFYYSLTKQRLSGWESRLLGLSCRKNSNTEREMGNISCVFCGCVEQASVGVVERWGRFEKLAEPGLHFFNPLAGQCFAGYLSTRISSLDVKIETKTKVSQKFRSFFFLVLEF